jgi:hypothetical protein
MAGDALRRKFRFQVKLDDIEFGGVEFGDVRAVSEVVEAPEIGSTKTLFSGEEFSISIPRSRSADNDLYEWMAGIAMDSIVEQTAPPGMAMELAEDPPLPGFKGEVSLKAKCLRFDDTIPDGTIRLEGPGRTVSLVGVTGPFRGPDENAEALEVSIGGFEYVQIDRDEA